MDRRETEYYQTQLILHLPTWGQKSVYEVETRWLSGK